MITPTNQTDSEGRPHGVWESYRLLFHPWWRKNYLHGKAHGLCVNYRSDDTPYSKTYFLNIK